MRIIWAIFYCCFVLSAMAGEDFSFSSIGYPLCGYDKYRVGSSCYSYSENGESLCKEVSGSSCFSSFVETSGDIADHYPFNFTFFNIGHDFSKNYVGDGTCLGDAVYGSLCLSSFVETSGTIADYYPFDFGFSNVSYALNNYSNMLQNDCLGAMDGYYEVDMNRYSKLVDSKCKSGATEYEILNDCQNIDMTIADVDNVRSPLHPDNYMCAVLCENGSGYLNTGECQNYCIIDDKVKRFYYKNSGKVSVISLWDKASTVPALHIKFDNDTICHVNLSTEVQSDGLVVEYDNRLFYSSK